MSGFPGPDEMQEALDVYDRVRGLRGDMLAPSPQVQSRVREAAAALDVEVDFVRKLAGGYFGWYAIVRTPRGSLERPVAVEASLLAGPDYVQVARAVDDAWQDAFRELSVLD